MTPMIVACRCPWCGHEWNAEFDPRGLLLPGWHLCRKCRTAFNQEGEFIGLTEPATRPGNDGLTDLTRLEEDDV